MSTRALDADAPADSAATPVSTIHERYAWLDRIRGLIVVFLLISMITYPLSGNFKTGEPILGPTYLNHGGKYYDGLPQMITMVDIGQQVFMFLMGFVAYLAFSSRLTKLGPASAWRYALRRVALLYLLAFLDDGLGPLLSRGELRWYNVLFHGTFANLALGALAGFAAMYLVRRAERRILLALAIMALHAWLYGRGWFWHWGLPAGSLPRIPFDSINHMSVAIVGTCFGEWVFRTRDQIREAFAAKVLPGCIAFLSAAYCMDWLQPAEPHDVTTAHALLAIGMALFLFGTTYSFGQIGFSFPVLEKFGRNMLLMFILAFIIVDVYVAQFSKEFLLDHRFLAMVLVGITPLVVLYGIAHLLYVKGVAFRV